ATAVVSGFILTAIPNWTGARRVAGTPLVVLVVLWLAGRAAMWFSGFFPAALVAVLDMAHLPALTILVALGLFVRPAPRNLIFLLLLIFLAGANGAVHAEWLGLTENSATGGLAFGLMTLSLLVVIIGGRVVPSFTRNALMRESGMRALPRSFPLLDRATIVASSLLIGCYLFAFPGVVTGAVALAAAIFNGARLAFWRSAAVLGEPILWSLHLAYAWIAVGYAALAGSHLIGAPHETAALHIIAIGAIGGMTLAVMTRAALGHTGRPLSVSRPVALAYGLIAIAAAVRGFGPGLMPSHYFLLIFLSGGLWISGFAIFAACYCSILIGPPLPKQQSTA
ncbi:MAG TPA: NnrS family protein, partial [Afifellaceae bacterium]|nr:NnrS family protein [Afifellaceae bacterium]